MTVYFPICKINSFPPTHKKNYRNFSYFYFVKSYICVKEPYNVAFRAEFVKLTHPYTMKQKIINVAIEVVTYDELNEADRRLVDTARQANQRSYAPYSKFRVGAAILLSNGQIVAGANQENAAFPSGTCAERTACYYAGATYPDAKFEKIAIAARGTDGNEVAQPIPPCGACRQALLEYETLAGKPVEVILVGANEIYRLQSVASLLPLAFTDF
jgi:cytidine deaminase